MQLAVSVEWVLATLLLSVRIGVVLAFAPPFTLTGLPTLVRVALGVSLASCLAAVLPPAKIGSLSIDTIAISVVMQAVIGMALAFALQAVFAGLYFVGRVLDIQAGFGLALLIDPNTSNQVPLLGTFFVYIAGIAFFAVDGPQQLLRLLAASLDAFPLDGTIRAIKPGPPVEFFTRAFAIALVTVSAAVLTLFLIDISIAFLSRTLPQMNVLLLGLQVKTLALLFVMAATFVLLGPVFIRLVESALHFDPRSFLVGQPGT